MNRKRDRLVTYAMTDHKGARVIISLRASLADDDLVASVMEILSVPPRVATVPQKRKH